MILFGGDLLAKNNSYILKEKNPPVQKLYSKVVNCQAVPGPFQLFNAGAHLFYGNRFYWQDPQREIVFIGFGDVRTFRVTEADGFAQIEKEWNELAGRMEIDQEIQEMGTGPLLFGGFAFDQTLGKREWAAFGQGIFRIPQILFTFKKDAVYLTVNAISNGQDLPGGMRGAEETARRLLTKSPRDPALPKVKYVREISAAKWKESVANAVRLIQKGEMDKVVLARKMEMAYDGAVNPDAVLLALSEQQHESYLFVLEEENESFVGASPERLIRKTDREILSTCLAGSIKRGRDEAEDLKLGGMLLSDKKNLNEHRFVVSMIQNVLAPFCSELIVPDAPVLMKMRDIQHLYTPVTGTVKDKETTIFKLAKALHPTPALGGIPRKCALEAIRRLEKMDRGLYGAPLGWVDYRGNGEFCVGIRSGLLKEDHAYLYAGCGVVADSVPEEEYKETGVKFTPMLRALGGK